MQSVLVFKFTCFRDPEGLEKHNSTRSHTVVTTKLYINYDFYICHVCMCVCVCVCVQAHALLIFQNNVNAQVYMDICVVLYMCSTLFF